MRTVNSSSAGCFLSQLSSAGHSRLRLPELWHGHRSLDVAAVFPEKLHPSFSHPISITPPLTSQKYFKVALSPF